MPRFSLHTLFHPLIADWFVQQIGQPTDVQRSAWPKIAAGEHVLVSAPTGSGKTFTAFLWPLHQLLTGVWPKGRVRVVYISPAKALNNDVQRNVIHPLTELQKWFRQHKEDCFPVRVMTRSGDTPRQERRQMLRNPPEILITTPESLNILISSMNGRRLLDGVQSVILDEIHAVAGSKRGTHLITAVDRLVPLCGEFQRVALSATIRPLARIADFIGGYQMEGDPREPVYRKRRVALVQSGMEKELDVSVCLPAEEAEVDPSDPSRWPVLADHFRTLIKSGRSTLLFANSRRLTEKITRLINEKEGRILAYAHHGSLSREIRLAVEQNLKQGRLRGIVATNSLELGIDIGDLDRVILIQTPPTVAAAVQRIGRSGHRVGLKSSGLLFPTHGRDFLNAAVMAKCIREQAIEETRPVSCPLDVLAQLIIAMTCVEVWDIDQLFARIRTSHPFHALSRKSFAWVLEMLEGRYSETRIRELRPKVSIDRVENTIQARDGMKMLVYMAGGTIPDRGYYNMRTADTRAKIGELDEEFVWERSVGDTFALGAQTWRIRKITHNDIEVTPVSGNPGIIPFWRAEARNRDFALSEKIGLFLWKANTDLDRNRDGLMQELIDAYRMDLPAAEALISFLDRQKAHAGADLPHRYHLLIEHFDDPFNQRDSRQVILHTLWGGRINRPVAMALAAAWEEQYQYPLEVFADDDAILLLLPHSFEPGDLFQLLPADRLETYLRLQLPKTGYFGAAFRENAGRALLLPRAGFQKRMPLWLNRLRSRKLLDAVMRRDHFPIVLETWRACLQDDFHLEHARMLLDEIETGAIQISQIRTSAPTPFASGLIWQQTNQHMYEDDTPSRSGSAGIRMETIREITGSMAEKPIIPEKVFSLLEAKLQRTAAGYAPSSFRDLLDWIKERLIVPETEWRGLLQAMDRDHGMPPDEIETAMIPRIVRIVLPNAEIRSVCALENLPYLAEVFSIEPGQMEIRPLKSGDDSAWESIRRDMETVFAGYQGEGERTVEDVIMRWLSCYGPIAESMIAAVFGLSDDQLQDCIAGLSAGDQVVRGMFRPTHGVPEVCERENVEILLRMARKARQPDFQPLSLDGLPLFLADIQGLTDPGDSVDDLQDRLDQLFGLCLPVAAWEENVFPARLIPYHCAWLDSLMQSSDLMWFGCGEKRIGFAFPEDLPLFQTESSGEARRTGPDMLPLLPEMDRRFGFFDLMNHFNMDSEQAGKAIWKLAWQGYLTNDTVVALREGILNRFKPVRAAGRKRGGRGRFNRWKSSRPLSGNWYRVGRSEKEPDPLEQSEVRKDRARQLFLRYGILFREIVTRELPALNWGTLLPTLRVMELSGEIVSGHFFTGISGLQFISHEAFRRLRQPFPEDAVFWMSANDPASVCGLNLDFPGNPLPARLGTTHLVYHGRRLVMVSKSSGKDLTLFASPQDPDMAKYLACFKVFLSRSFHPVRSVLVQTINHEPAGQSVYAEAFRAIGFSREYKGLELRKRFV